jgi:hypothetical protein
VRKEKCFYGEKKIQIYLKKIGRPNRLAANKERHQMPAFMIYLSLPLVIMNTIAPLIAIPWLIYLGEYRLLLLALFASIVSPVVYALAMVPALAIILPGVYLLHKENRILKSVGTAIAAIGGLWGYMLMAAWTMYVFGYTPEVIFDGSIPHTLLAYCVATVPFTIMASREGSHNWGAHFATLINQTSSALLVVMIISGAVSLQVMIISVLGFIITGYTVGLINGLLSQLAHRGAKKEDH